MARGTLPARFALAAIVACACVALPAAALGDVGVAETPRVSDAVTVLPPVTVAVSESITASDAPSVMPPAVVAVAEGVHATDAVTAVPPALVTDAEGVTALDAVSVLPPVGVATAEPVGVTDAPLVVPPTTVSVGENVQAHDGSSAETVNTAPKLAAIADTTANEGAPFSATGSFADPDPQTWTATVQYGDGGSPELLQLTAAKTFALRHVYDDNGTYTVSVVVSDGTATDTTTFHVDVANVAPTALVSNSGPVDEGGAATVSLTGVTDPSHADTAAGFTYAFDCGSGYAAATGPSASCTFDDDGSFPVRAKVSDKDGGTTELTTTVVVRNVAPTATLGNNGPVGEGSPVTIAFAGANDPSHADMAAGLHFAFSCDGAPLTTSYDAAGTDPTTTCTFPDNGTYTVSGRVIDKNNGATNATTTVTVTNVAPTADLTNDGPVDEASPVHVTVANVSDPSPVDTAAGFRYRFDCGTGYGPFGTAPATTCAYDDGPSSHVVHAQVADKDGGTTDLATTVTVRNVAPTSSFTAPAPIDEGGTFTLALASPHDVSGADTAAGFTYAFDCGDGAGPSAFSAATTRTCATTDNGTRAVQATIRDKDGGQTTYTGTVDVRNVAPTATFVTPGPVDEGSPIALTLTGASDPSSADTLAGFSYAFDCGSGYGPPASTASASCVAVNDPSQSVGAKIIDKDGGTTEYRATVTVRNVAPTVTITGPPSGTLLQVGQSATFTGTFTDPGVTDTHTALWTADGVPFAGTVTDNGGNGTVTATRTFTTAGVYSMGLTVTDNSGGVGSATSIGASPAYVVVFDPNAGFVNGGGWIDAGAAGKASFDIAAKYEKGKLVPTGDTSFQVGKLAFKSTAYAWLVVAGANAQYKGTGTVNGSGGFGFLATATDGDQLGKGQPDRFRMKIWRLDTGAVVYDNVPGASDDIDVASPQALGGGSIVVHR